MDLKKLSVLQLLPELEGGGVERGTLEVANALVNAGHRSLVMSHGGRMVEQLEQDGSQHLRWPVHRKSPLSLSLVVPMRKLLREERVDILHVRSRMPAWIAYLAWRGMASHHRPRFLTTTHGLYKVNPYSAVMTRGERIVAVSQTVAAYLTRRYRVDPGRVVLIPRGVDREVYAHGWKAPESWQARWWDSQSELKGRRLILLPGRLTRLKGHKDLFKLMLRLRELGVRNVHALVVGDGKPGYRAALESEASGQKLSVSFLGHREDLREIMSVTNVVLSLSQQPESFGRTVLEALSLGIPVVGYNHGGVGELLESILPGGGVAMGDIDELAQRVSEWLVQPPRVPRDHPFELSSMLSRTLALYDELGAGRVAESTSRG